MKFINFTCLKIKQNHISSCSLLIITYESILGFSYSSSFFMQIRLKKILLAVLLLKNLAKYNKEINMKVKFLMITFKQSCVIMFLKFFWISWVFQKNLYEYHFWLVGLLEEKFFHQALFNASDEESLKEASCKISTRSDNYFRSYDIFSFFHLVGWLVWLDCSTFLWSHQNLGKGPSWSRYHPCKISMG